MTATQKSIDIDSAEGRVVRFFRDTVSDATPLDTDPWDRAWEATIDGDRAGMLVIEDMFSPSLVRLAVREQYRREGVATALLEHALSERDEWSAYVDEDNDACQSLLAGLGFEKGGYAPPPNLERWTWEREDTSDTEGDRSA